MAAAVQAEGPSHLPPTPTHSVRLLLTPQLSQQSSVSTCSERLWVADSVLVLDCGLNSSGKF